VDSLVEDGTLNQEQAARVVARLRPLLPAAAESPSRGGWIEFAGYLGGALFLGGMSLVVVPTWDDLAYPARLGLAATVTLILLAAAVVVGRRAGGGSPVQGRLASTLGALGAGGASVTAAVVSPGLRDVLAGSIAALVVAAAGYLLLRGAPLLVAACAASVVAVGTVLEEFGVTSEAGFATAFALLGAGWLALGLAGLVRERSAAAMLGGLIGLGAGQTAAIAGDQVAGDGVALYGLAIGVVFLAACFGGYLATRRWPLLVPAVLIALIVPATALANVLDSGLAAGATVAAVGALILAAGGVTLIARRTAH
jgi:hypothetical protein